MKIGVPKEIKNQESRVGVTPAGVKALTEAGHSVFDHPHPCTRGESAKPQLDAVPRPGRATQWTGSDRGCEVRAHVPSSTGAWPTRRIRRAHRRRDRQATCLASGMPQV